MTDLPVAEEWFEIKQLEEGLFRISEPHVVNFMRGNMFVAKTDSACLLIDGGNGVVPLRPFLASHGLEPTIVVASHAHADHIGALHEWPFTYIHETEAAGLAELDPDLTLAGPEYDIMDMSTIRTGDPSLQGSTITALPYAGFTSKDYKLQAPRVRAIQDGHVFDLGTRRFDVLHVPGHCPGQLVFWDAANKILIGCDAIYDGVPFDLLHNSNRPDNRRSLQRLLELDPVVTHGGHFGPIANERFREVIETYLAETA